MYNFIERRKINNYKRRRNKGKFTRFKRSKYNRNKNIPVISSKPIRLGAGTASINITNFLGNSTTGQRFTYLFSSIFNTNEFTSKSSDYMYFKINFIKLIIFPNNVASNKINYFLVNWVNDNDGEVLNLSDNTKIVPSYLTRIKVFTFIPPNVTVNSYKINDYISTQVTPFIGCMHYYLGDSMQCMVETNVTFRGSRDFNLGKMMEKLNLITEENENKEDEKEEEKELDKRGKSKKKEKKKKEKDEEKKDDNKKKEIKEEFEDSD
jgi:hypothetical protein